MQERHLFEYAVIRIVPRVEREEFLNTGVIVYCKSLRYLDMKYVINHDKLKAFARDIDCEELKQHLTAFSSICAGKKDAGPIALLEPALRFRWLTAWRSTIVQTSRVHPGLTTDANATLNRLFEQLVL
ncbi:DUF3037 domain-containing protein [Nostoc ellipsosporum NOK]|nr:DUF3037 domain-containing protein [Nostoc ellipsosporum NOK]